MSGFGKVFAGLYEGSMLGAGVHVFALWPYCISRSDAHGNVEVNPRLAAVVLGCSIPEVESALDYLMRPDPESRSKEEEGRRLIRVGQFAYRIVNYAKYREARDTEARREYQREWDRTNRPTRPDRTRHVPTNPTQAEAEAEAEAEAHPAHRTDEQRAPFAAFWAHYPRKVGKGRAESTWARMSSVHRVQATDAVLIFAGVWACAPEDRRTFIPHPATWLSQKRWEDDPADWQRQARGTAPAPRPAPTLIGSHPPGPKLREIDEDSPEEIVEIVSRLRRREATDAEIATLDAWQRGSDAH